MTQEQTGYAIAAEVQCAKAEARGFHRGMICGFGLALVAVFIFLSVLAIVL